MHPCTRHELFEKRCTEENEPLPVAPAALSRSRPLLLSSLPASTRTGIYTVAASGVEIVSHLRSVRDERTQSAAGSRVGGGRLEGLEARFTRFSPPG